MDNCVLKMTWHGFQPVILDKFLTGDNIDTPSFHVDGRYNSAEAPDAQVVHITHG